MRLRSVLSEALRNIGAGVSHALLMFAAVLFASTLLGGYEAANVVGLETEAVQRINAYADVGAIVGGTVDGAACDRLADAGGGVMGTLAGAMRAGQQIVPLATPGKDISSYEVTPGMIRMIARNTKNRCVRRVGIYRRGQGFWSHQRQCNADRTGNDERRRRV